MSDRASVVNYITSAFTFGFSALTSQELIAATGLLIAVLTFATNIYFKRRIDRRQHELHQLQVAKLNQELDIPPESPDIR